MLKLRDIEQAIFGRFAMPAIFASQFSLRSIQPKAQLSTARIHKLTDLRASTHHCIRSYRKVRDLVLHLSYGILQDLQEQPVHEQSWVLLQDFWFW